MPRRSFVPQFLVLEDRTVLSVLTVLNNADSGAGSLRAAIAAAQSGDTILFDSSLTGQTITLRSGELCVDQDLTIRGPGACCLTISGNRSSRVFEIAGADVCLSGLTIAQGNACDGGGICTDAGLTLSDCVFSGNVASDQGGALFNTGTLTVNDCTFVGNTAVYGASVLNNGMLTASSSALVHNLATDEGGGVFNTGVLNISSCTLADNLAGFESGGLFSDGVLTLTNSTLAGNISLYGGGIYGLGVMTISSCTMASNVAGIEGGGICTGAHISARNTLIAANTAPLGPDFAGSLTSLGHNLIGNPSDGCGYAATDLLNTDPLLGPLQDNGGSTQTMALLPGSPAVDTGDPTNAPAWDQRGTGFPRVVGGKMDIGAFQVQLGPATHFQVSAPAHVLSNAPFDVTITALDAYGHPAIGYLGTVTFACTDTDPRVLLPADYTFTAQDQGVHTFAGSFVLVTPGEQTITASDTDGNSICGDAIQTVDPVVGPFLASGSRDFGRKPMSGNRSPGGAGWQGNTTGNGLGGSVYVDPSASASADMQTLIAGNQSSKSNNDVWGTITIVP
jgi:hypothetical protein